MGVFHLFGGGYLGLFVAGVVVVFFAFSTESIGVFGLVGIFFATFDAG